MGIINIQIEKKTSAINYINFYLVPCSLGRTNNILKKVGSKNCITSTLTQTILNS